MNSIYKKALLDHFHNPVNRGDMHGASRLYRGRNPRCGDEVEVGLYYAEGSLMSVRFQGRGCSVCIASASMMTEAVNGLNESEVVTLCHDVQDWFSMDSESTNAEIPDSLLPLNSIRGHRSRKKCALLCWEALESALCVQ